MKSWQISLAFLALLLACASKSKGDRLSDANISGEVSPPDAASKDVDTPFADDATALDSTDSMNEASPQTFPCEPTPQGRLKPQEPNPKKFALAVFHFNIQYVAGGISGMVPKEMDPEGVFDYDNDALEDRIVKESFEPLLDIFLDHPKFAGDIELQGYMLEVLAQRHPKVLEKLRTLVKRGQVAVQSFHYSDQLFTAHSRFGISRGLALNKTAFDRACIPLAKAVFTQEGQFSEGMLEMMKEAQQTIAIMKGGLFDYQYSDVPPALLYSLRGQDVVTTKGLDLDGFSVRFYFVGDGETLLTADTNPYLGSAFKFDPASADRFVDELNSLLAQGYFLTTVQDYVQYLHEAGVKPVPLPYSIDGTWRPADSHNLFAWMGRGGLFGTDEADNEVLTSLERARIALQAAETALIWAQGQDLGLDHDHLSALLWQGIRSLVLGEVSDSTGWNPWRGEVRYSLEHAKAAFEAASQVLEAVRSASTKPVVLVDIRKGEVKVGPDPLKTPDRVPVEEAPLQVSVSTNFEYTSKWLKWLTEAQKPLIFEYILTLKRKDPSSNFVRIEFERTEDRLIYSPAMLDEVADLPLSQIPGHEGKVNVPCANGLLGLGGNRFLIKDLQTVHLAAFLPKDKKVVFFEDQTLNGEGPYTLRFFLLTEATKEEALDFAVTVNSAPKVQFPPFVVYPGMAAP